MLWLTRWFGLLITGLSVLFDACGRWVIRGWLWLIVLGATSLCYLLLMDLF